MTATASLAPPLDLPDPGPLMSNAWGLDPAGCQTAMETGYWHLRNFLTPQQQDFFAVAARELKARAPFASPTMRDGTKMGVKVTSFGKWGWWADKLGYRYIDKHPTTNEPFPELPKPIWAATCHAMYAASYFSRQVDPTWTTERWGIPSSGELLDNIDTCLVNFYALGTELGWHIDQTERARYTPIVTFSLGATADFEIKLPVAGESRVFRCTLRSGDAVVMAGPARTAEHRIVRVREDSQASLFGGDFYNPLEASKVRLSFTLRRTGL